MKRLVLLLVCFFKLQAQEPVPQKILMVAPATVETRLTSWSETADMGRPYSTLLGQRDINNKIPAYGVMKTLSTPGRYYLTESILMSPINSNVTCLKITSSNVVLDLRGHSITGTTMQGAGMCAIEVESMLSNVTICNGTINAINGNAIKTGISCNNVTIRDMVVNNCTDVGINFSCTDSIIERVKIFSCNNFLISSAAGLYLNGAHRVKIRDCQFDNNWSFANHSYGIYIGLSSYVELLRCSSNQNAGGSGLVAYNAYGFYASSSNNLTFKDCESFGTATSTGTAYGFCLEYCNSALLESCVANRNSASGAPVYGFRIDNSNRCLLKDCRAFDNTSNHHAYGFMAYQSYYNSFENCQAIGQSSTSFLMSTTVAGFASLGSRGNVFKGCVASGNVAASIAGARAVGFYFSEAEKYSHIIGSYVYSNNGASGTAYGIFLDGAQWSTVKNNQIYANIGDTNGYGIRDSSISSINMFVQNFAYGNGSSDGTIVNNYDVKPSPADTANAFPVKIGYLTSLANFDTANSYHNLELIEQTA